MKDIAESIPYTLLRSKRRTCAIHIRSGAVEVRAPIHMPKRDIDRFVSSKAKWIHQKLADCATREKKRSAFSLTYGDTVRYRGKDCTIISKPGNRAGLSDDGFYMPPDLSPEQIKSACIQIYRLCAKQALTEKTATFAAVMGCFPSAVKVTGAKTRWGSCSGKKNLNFSWRLMMADDPVIDYVVVHELAHLKEMNHSPRFWAQVERILPDYRERQNRLKILQERLRTENWEE